MKLDSGGAILFGGMLFVLFFIGMTLVVLIEDGLTILVFFAILICILLVIALYGAISTPPDDRNSPPRL